MNSFQLFSDAHDVGRAATRVPIERVRSTAQAQLRQALGLREVPAPPCHDPALAYVDPAGATRALHADLPVMLIGGVASLFLQSLHPGAMAGVAQHSTYAGDPLGRLERTARFIATTTYGTSDDAAAAIRRVQRLHDRVVGTDDGGSPYRASDPALLRWVHAAEVASFISAHRRYGAREVEEKFYDAYLDEMSHVALDLGAQWVPTSLGELDDYFRAVRPELAVTEGTLEVRRFLLEGVGRLPHQVVVHQIIVAGARDILPAWAAELLELEHLPGTDRLVVRPAAHSLAGILRLIVPVPSAHAD